MASSGTLMRRLQDRLDKIFIPMARFVECCRRRCVYLVRALLATLPLSTLRFMHDLMLYMLVTPDGPKSGSSGLQTRQAFERKLLPTTAGHVVEGDCIICKSTYDQPASFVEFEKGERGWWRRICCWR